MIGHTVPHFLTWGLGIEECGITRPDRSKRTSAETDGKSGISMVLWGVVCLPSKEKKKGFIDNNALSPNESAKIYSPRKNMFQMELEQGKFGVHAHLKL